MPQEYESAKAQRCGGVAEFGLLNRWTDYVDISGYLPAAVPSTSSTIDKNLLVEAFKNIPESIPSLADPHPIYAETYCTGTTIQLYSGASESVRAAVGWEQIGRDRKTGVLKIQTQIDVFQQQIVNNYDINGKQCVVSYTIPKNGMQQQFNKKASDIHIPKLIRNLRVVCYEDLLGYDPSQIAYGIFSRGVPFPKKPFYNLTPIWGFPKANLLFTGVKSTSEGTTIHRREYNYLINDQEWDKFWAVFTQPNGLIPNDIPQLNFINFEGHSAAELMANPVNGYGVFDMLDSAEFGDLFAQLPVDTTAVPNQ